MTDIEKETAIVSTSVVLTINEIDTRYSVCHKWTINYKYRSFIRYHELESEKTAYITLVQRNGESLIDAVQRGNMAYNSMETELSLSMSKVKKTII